MSIPKLSLLLLLPCLVVMTSRVQAAPQPTTQTCQPAQADAADAMVDTLHDWAAVDRYFKAYRQCDQGSMAEGSADAIARLLARHWTSLPKLQALIRQEPALRSFVLNRIERNASTHCPADAASLCAALRQSVKQALH